MTPDKGSTAAALHKDLRNRFRAAGLATPELDARILVLETLGLSLAELLGRPDTPVAAAGRDELEERARRRLAGEPVHRIIGHRSFYGLDLALSPETLEPRPDTEILVDALKPRVEATIATNGCCRILDLGTGTGAICLALLSLYPEACGAGADISVEALRTAAANAARLGLKGRFSTVRSDWFSTVETKFDVIVSNPPYIRSRDMESLSKEVRAHDPHRALDGGSDGLDAHRRIAAGSAACLTVAGSVGVEIGFDQRREVTALFEESGYTLVEARADFSGNDRVLIFRPR